jgi:hypothetical protein
MNREELLKNAKPILFNTEMVQAILEGKKSVTRRIIKQGNILPTGDWLGEIKEGGEWCTNPRKDVLWTGFRSKYGADAYYMCRYQVGDILYVRETFNNTETDTVLYAADKDFIDFYLFMESEIKWKPSIHMPKEAARIFLRVTNVRVERVQEITEEDAIAEGMSKTLVDGVVFISAKGNFHVLWDSLNIKRGYGWDTNPWVWVIEFERINKEG